MGSGLGLLLGLGLPRSFLLLDAVLLALAWLGGRRPGPAPSRLLLWSSGWLLLFGLSYGSIQIGWGVWWPPRQHGPELVAMLMPAAALAVGWFLPRCASRRQLSAWIVAYGAGALVYALLCLALSRSPWWNVAQSFVHNVRVPWGSQPWMNMRSVEQRAFVALGWWPVALPCLWGLARQRWRAVPLLVMAALAAHAAWAFQGRIGVVVLALASLPGLWSLRRQRWRLGLLAVGSVAVGVGLASGRLCDERGWLQLGFVQRLAQAPWGGRQIAFTYRDCRPELLNRFGPGPDAAAFSPHNLVLDIYNDAGWLPALCVLLAVMPLLWVLLRGFWGVLQRQGWSADLALRWSCVALVVVQWLLQPFWYADQLMCILGFLLAGALLAEFNRDTPGGWSAARPSHPDKSPLNHDGCTNPEAVGLPEDPPR